MSKIKIIALFGKAGSGKDTLQRWLINNNQNFNGIISCTTRPKRDYEEDKKDYFFLSRENFTIKVLNGDMLEATEFNDWFYGTSIEALDENKINIGVFNPTGINCLYTDSRIELFPIYITVSDKTRLLRQLNREQEPNCHEICRRFFTDEKDFYIDNFDFDFIEYENEDNKDFIHLQELINDMLK